MCINYLEGLDRVYLNSDHGQNILDGIKMITGKHSTFNLGTFRATQSDLHAWNLQKGHIADGQIYVDTQRVWWWKYYSVAALDYRTSRSKTTVINTPPQKAPLFWGDRDLFLIVVSDANKSWLSEVTGHYRHLLQVQAGGNLSLRDPQLVLNLCFKVGCAVLFETHWVLQH